MMMTRRMLPGATKNAKPCGGPCHELEEFEPAQNTYPAAASAFADDIAGSARGAHGVPDLTSGRSGNHG